MSGIAPTNRTRRATPRALSLRLGAALALLLGAGCSGTSLVPDTFDVMPARVNGGMGRAFHAAVWMADQQNLMLVGGQGANGTALANTEFAERISCSSCSLIAETSLNPAIGRVNPVAMPTADGVLIAGGQVSGVEPATAAAPPTVLPVSTAVTDALHYRPASITLDTVTQAGGANGAALARLNGADYLIGGRDTTSNVSAAILEFDGFYGFTHGWDMARAREGHTATPLKDGRVLIVGGFGLAGFPEPSAELFDPALGTTELTGGSGPLYARALHTATASADGCEVLIYGGVDAVGLVAEPELYTSADAGCGGDGLFHPVPLASAADRRVYHSATRLNNGDVLIAGGVADDTGSVTGSARLYSFFSNTMRDTAAPLSFPRFGHSASVMLDGTVLVAGGLDALLAPVPEVERYVPTTF